MTSDVKALTTSLAKAYVSWTTAPRKLDLKILFRTAIGSILNDWAEEVLFVFECWSPSFFEYTFYLNIVFVFHTNVSRIYLHRFQKLLKEARSFSWKKRNNSVLLWQEKGLREHCRFPFWFPLDPFPSCQLSRPPKSGGVKEKMLAAVVTGSIQLNLAR